MTIKSDVEKVLATPSILEKVESAFKEEELHHIRHLIDEISVHDNINDQIHAGGNIIGEMWLGIREKNENLRLLLSQYVDELVLIVQQRHI